MAPRQEFENLKRQGGSSLALLAHTVTSVGLKLHPTLNASTIWDAKFPRQELHRKFMECIERDTHPDRQGYCKELGRFAREWLDTAVARAEREPSQRMYMNLADAVSVAIGPREMSLQAAEEERKKSRLARETDNTIIRRPRFDERRRPPTYNPINNASRDYGDYYPANEEDYM